MKYDKTQIKSFSSDNCKYDFKVKTHLEEMIEYFKNNPYMVSELPITRFAGGGTDLEKVYLEKIDNSIIIKCKHGFILENFDINWIERK